MIALLLIALAIVAYILLRSQGVIHRGFDAGASSASNGVLRRQGVIHRGFDGWLPQRIFAYTLAFAALLAILFAVSILLTIAIGAVTEQLGVVSASDLRSRAGLSIAALIVGMPTRCVSAKQQRADFLCLSWHRLPRCKHGFIRLSGADNKLFMAVDTIALAVAEGVSSGP